MVDGRRGVLAVIPARGGSRSLPKKHLRLLGGQPLIAHTIRAALAAGAIDHVLVSTDDPAIRRVANRFGAEAPFLRPARLSTDEAPTAPVIWHAVGWWEERRAPPWAVVILQPTSPLRTAEQIDAAVAMLGREDVDSVVSVVTTGLPVSVLGTTIDGIWHRMSAPLADPRRQAAPVAFRLTGGIYATLRASLSPDSILGNRIGTLVVDGETAIDIDAAPDLAAARRLLRMRS